MAVPLERNHVKSRLHEHPRFRRRRMAESLSLCIITRDAAGELAECVESARFADDIVVVDSGSRDDTVEVARRLGARVIEHPFTGFGAQKQYAVAAARHDWVLCLDADERVTPELAAGIAQVLARDNPGAAAFALARRNRFLGRWLSHGEGYPDWNVRLFDRRYARWSDDVVHERVIVDGHAARVDGDLLHASAESLTEYIAKQNRYTSLQAEAMHREGRTAGFALIALAPLARFIRLYFFRLGFLDGAAGFAHIAVGAFGSFLKYAKLRALRAGDGE
jgi:glycosyltransferase involved in cell wall biosynthesis